MNDIATKKFSLTPKTMEEALQYAKLISDSDLAPKDFKGKPGNVLIAIQMGAEVGLSPMQALQNIAVINGRPAIWGDAAIAIVRAYPKCGSIKEWLEGNIKDVNATAYISIKRKGEEEQIRSFSIDDAKRAGLWGKPGPWTQYPARMLQMRARGFGLRDVFPDALKGLNIAEEIIDTPSDQIIDNQEDKKASILSKLHNSKIQASLPIQNETTNANIEISEIAKFNDDASPSFNDVKKQMESSITVDDLILAADVAKSIFMSKEERDELAKIYKDKQSEVKA